MATSIYFNGRSTSVPGSYTEVDATGLTSVGLGASGIVACIGEAEGGQPNVVNTVTNPGSISRTYRQGDLREAGAILFDPSKDGDIQAGAQAVKFVKVNPATQSSTTLLDSAVANSVTFTSRDYGAFTDKINVNVSDGTTAGTKAIAIALDSATETFDNLGATPVAELEYVGPWTAANATFSPITSGLSIAVSGTLTTEPGLGDRARLITTGSLLAGQPNGTETLRYTSSDPGDTLDVYVYGIVGGLADSEQITLTGTAPVTGSKVFTGVLGVYVDGAPAGTVTIDGTTSSTVVTTLSAGSTSAGLSSNFANAPITLIDSTLVNPISVSSSNAAATEPVMVIGTTTGGVPASESVLLTGTGSVPFSTVFDTISLIAYGATPLSDTLEFNLPLRAPSSVVTVSSANAADTAQTLTIYGMDAAGAAQVETVALNGTTDVTTTGTFKYVIGAKLSAATAGDVNIVSKGSADTPAYYRHFPLAAGDLAFGVESSLNAAPNGPVTLTLPAGPFQFQRTLIVGTNASGAPTTELLSTPAATSSTSWATIDTITTGCMIPGGAAITYTPVNLPIATYATLDTWQAHFADQPEFDLTKKTPVAGENYQIANLDAFAADVATAYSIRDILNSLIVAVNAGSSFVTAARASGATLPPANTSLPVFLTGGGEGTTAFSNWQSALDLLREEQVNTVVVLTDDPAVHAATIAHCAYMCGAGRGERDCVLGAPSGTTLSDAKALALTMNTRHARLVIQDVERYNTSGELEEFAPPFAACVAAGMQAGSEVGTSLTFKYANVLDVINDSTYNLKDNGDELINAGLCVIEKVPNRGFRWLRNVTTYLQDNNLAYTEASVNEAVNYAVLNFREALEEVVGQKGFAGTVTAAEGLAINILGQLVREGVITTYRNLTIVLTDDTMTVDVEIAPVNPVNFVKSTVHLVSSTFANA